MNKEIIKIQNVHKSFQLASENLKVITGIDFSVYEGEFVIIIGPSGSGKTTLLHMITGWEKPNSGEVLLDGKDIYSEAETKRTKIYKKRLIALNQQQLWIKHLNAIENVEVPQLLNGVSRKEAHKRAKSVLELFGMSEYSKHKPEDLSGGQQQMFNMIRTLMNNPDIIIADEPTGNMDHKSATHFMNILKTVNEQLHRTIIMTTHDLSLVNYSTRTILLLDGEIKDIVIQNKDFVSSAPTGDILDIDPSLVDPKEVKL
jgi:putative ABC transport system ATP-binding protein